MIILKDTTKLVRDIGFPALTICGSGVHFSHVEKKLVHDFNGLRAQNKRNGTTYETIKKDLEDFMETRFQIKPNQTEGERLLTILDIIETSMPPSRQTVSAKTQWPAKHQEGKKRSPFLLTFRPMVQFVRQQMFPCARGYRELYQRRHCMSRNGSRIGQNQFFGR